MKYKYKIKKFTYHNGKEDLIIVMDDEKYRMVAQFLMSDIQGQDPQYVFEAIDNVLSEKSEYEELNGNVCGVEIHREKTKIYDNLAEDGMGHWCEIETNELRELVNIWCNELKKFKAQSKDATK